MVKIDIFSKIARTIGLKNRNSQSIKDAFENIPKTSERKSNLLESDDGSKIVHKTFASPNTKIIKRYYSLGALGAVFAERFNLTIRDLLKKVVFIRSDAKWIDVLPTITKQNIKRKHSSIKLTLVEASLKKNEGYVYKNLLDKRKIVNPKFQLNDFVRVADLKKTFSKGDTTNWSCKLYKK